jgi:two-component system response regulator AlgR
MCIRILIAAEAPAEAVALAQAVAELRPHWEVKALVQSREALANALDDLVPDVVIAPWHFVGAPGQGGALPLGAKGNPALASLMVIIGKEPAHAVEALDGGAVDYVMKPYRSSRLAQALCKAEQLHQGRRIGASGAGAPLVPGVAWKRWLTGMRGTDVLILDPADIVYFQAERKYTIAVLSTGRALLRQGLGDVERLLTAHHFVRVHRSTIVRVDKIDFLRRDEMGRLRAHMKNGRDVLTVSRSFEQAFKDD